ncbi:methenyl tetrahydrofolate cyclohydrolase [Thermoanaerobacter kivui]|uniref:Methenyl tetrahydrofolate cyclohydrolase n=1 Tax=Thermoanaerobacter kivui TaxID=2325 RepID=A0A097ATM5_THEKI|nr:cyclodeaminase/cyclohydrolase family protein [Thermoanaerobacter kivui]AIS53149.1 methenyl tetrahydrofolate cyclohydrolase [Thermoanaerobacter kivui]
MLVDDKVKEYLAKVKSGSPLPGCGSVSALVAGLGMALSIMVYNLTMSKDFYNEYDISIKEEMGKWLKISNELFEEYVKLIDEDVQAYMNVLKAMKIAKEDERQGKLRQEAIKKAYIDAINVPMKIARLCDQGFLPILIITKYGNPNARADAVVGAILLYAALQSAVIIVKANLSYIEDKEIIENTLKECNILIEKCKSVKDEILNLEF